MKSFFEPLPYIALTFIAAISCGDAKTKDS